MNAVVRHAVQRAIGLEKALDRRRRVGNHRARTPRQARCQLEFGDALVDGPGNEGSASDCQGAGKQPLADRTDVLSGLELRDADGGSHERPTAIHSNRQHARIGEPAAAVEPIDAAGMPVPDAALDGADPHVAVAAGERRHRGAGQF